VAVLLAIDIGNTNIVIGVFDRIKLIAHVRLPTRPDSTADEAGFLVVAALERIKVKSDDITDVVVGSVVPRLTVVFGETVPQLFGCNAIVVSHRVKLPVTIAIDQPEQVGADRIANAAAGYHKFGGPIIIVDFGTATTFDVVNEKGAYLGGVITPGPETSMAELARKAARLFDVRIEAPEQVVGKSTAAALKSGLFYGTVGQVDYIIDRIIEETGFKRCHVVATGGLAEGIEKESRHVKLIEPTLTLEGLRLISEMNQS
jgi:type III pantothenate kinase